MKIMKLAGLLLAVASYAGVIQADGIDGIVRDAGGHPVSALKVRLVELGIETETDLHGHFHFDVSPGTYRVEVMDGEFPVSQTVEVGEAAVFVRLQITSPSLGRMIVTAAPLPGRSPLDMARPVTVLAGEDLARKSAVSIGEAVASELGVTATSFGQASSRPVIRGLGSDRVRVLLGGIGTLDVSTTSDDHGVTIEPLLADQVEILRGPATLLYGTGAIGGVVNVIDNRIPERMPAHGFEGRAEFRGSTGDGERSGILRADGRLGDRVAWHFSTYRRKTGDYDIPGFAESAVLREQESHDDDDDHDDEEVFGRLPNSDLRNQGATVGLSRIVDRGFFGFSVSKMDNEYGIPGGHGHEDDHEDDHEEEEVRVAQKQTRYDFAGGIQDPFKGIRLLRARLGVNDYEHAELEEGAVETLFTNQAWEGRLELTHTPTAGGWEGALGLQASRREFSAIGEEAFTPPVDTDETGVFWVEERDFERVKVELGARLERVEHSPSIGPDLSFNLTSISAGLTMPTRGEVELVLDAGRHQRAPVAEELYSDGPHLATATFELGDPTLGEESSTAVEFGIRDQRGDFRWSITTFRNKFDDFIYLEDTGGVDPDSELPIFIHRQQGATFKGVEAELVTTVAEGDWGRLGIRVFGDRVSARLDDTTRVPRIPPRRIGLTVQYAGTAWSGHLDWIQHAAQDELAPGELPTEGYRMLNADLNRRIHSGSTEWFVYLRGSNLLDEDARRHTSFLKDVAPLPGRRLQAGVRLGF